MAATETDIGIKEPLAYGKYLAEAAGCMICHTKVDQQENPIGTPYIGSREFNIPPMGGKVYSVNITPDNETGIGSWTKETFITVIRERAKQHGKKVSKGDSNTLMPYWAFAGMTDKDLGAIYDYLRTLEPVKNKVTRWVPNSES